MAMSFIDHLPTEVEGMFWSDAEWRLIDVHKLTSGLASACSAADRLLTTRSRHPN